LKGLRAGWGFKSADVDAILPGKIELVGLTVYWTYLLIGF